MELRYLSTGMFESNCYVVGNNGEGIVIDPGAKASSIVKLVEEMKLDIKYILLTHAHIDHMCYLDEARSMLNARVMVHEADAPALSDEILNGSALFTIGMTFKEADILLQDRYSFEVGGMKFEIIHTPGHSPGSICIKTGNYLFTGDTLFRMSVGRTDLGKGSHRDLMNSIKNKLMVLDDNVVVYPGHGESSTIAFERENNPFIRLG
ncbi:MAG TPA: MBL fold metallo-hydrolase [Clostridiaceae bacterium]|nr:MBL fold metallo-hydrolase [Clostridiaceae bacterium]